MSDLLTVMIGGVQKKRIPGRRRIESGIELVSVDGAPEVPTKIVSKRRFGAPNNRLLTSYEAHDRMAHKYDMLSKWFASDGDSGTVPFIFHEGEGMAPIPKEFHFDIHTAYARAITNDEDFPLVLYWYDFWLGYFRLRLKNEAMIAVNTGR